MIIVILGVSCLVSLNIMAVVLWASLAMVRDERP